MYPTIITSKRALEEIGYLDEHVPSWQEWDTSIRLAKYCRIFHLKEPLLVQHVGNSDMISGSATKHVEGWHYIISKYERDIKELCGEEAWLKLNIQLLGMCLDLGLVEYYDRYRGKVGIARKHRLQMLYLTICRRYRIRPDIIINRFSRRLLGKLGYFGAG
jgi:hypothetical protein